MKKPHQATSNKRSPETEERQSAPLRKRPRREPDKSEVQTQEMEVNNGEEGKNEVKVTLE